MAQNAKAVAYSYKNRLNTPLETAIWWSEHVAATGGGPLLHSHAIDLPWYVYHSLDIYALIIFVMTLTIFMWVWIIKRFCGGEKKSSKGKTE